MTSKLLPTSPEALQELVSACEYSPTIGDKYLRRYGLNLMLQESWAACYPVGRFETDPHDPTRTPSQLGTLMVLSGAKANLRCWLDIQSPRLEDSYWTWPQHYTPTPNPGDRAAHLLEVLVTCQRSGHLHGLREQVIPALQQLILDHPGLLHPRFGFRLRSRTETSCVSLAGALAILDVPLPTPTDTPDQKSCSALARSAVTALAVKEMSSRCWSHSNDLGGSPVLKVRSLRSLGAKFGPPTGDFMRSVLELFGAHRLAYPVPKAGLKELPFSDDAHLAGKALGALAAGSAPAAERSHLVMQGLNASGLIEHQSFRHALASEIRRILNLDTDGVEVPLRVTESILGHLGSLSASWIGPGRSGAAKVLAEVLLGAGDFARQEGGAACAPRIESCIQLLGHLSGEGLPIEALRSIAAEAPSNVADAWMTALGALQLEASMRDSLEAPWRQAPARCRRSARVL
jgi:hypothetical protein